jgi:hypothetical protein
MIGFDELIIFLFDLSYIFLLVFISLIDLLVLLISLIDLLTLLLFLLGILDIWLLDEYLFYDVYYYFWW